MTGSSDLTGAARASYDFMTEPATVRELPTRGIPPREALEELSLATVEVASAAVAGDRAHALEWIPVCESWNRRLVVGTYLRRGRLSDFHLAKSRLLEERLEELEHAAEDAPREEVRDRALAASRAFQYVSRAWTTEPLD